MGENLQQRTKLTDTDNEKKKTPARGLYIPSKKSSAQVGDWVNSAYTGMVTLNVIYRCLKKSFCNIVMHSKL